MQQNPRILAVTSQITNNLKLRAISAYSIAKKTGMSRGNLSKILSGKQNTTLNTLINICDAADLEIIIRPKNAI